MKDASGSKAGEAKCSRAMARNAHCQKRFPNSFQLAPLPMIRKRFPPARLGSGRIDRRAAVCELRRECGRNLYRNMPGSAKLISITGNGSVPGVGG
jgi:hypothetical protein